MSAVRKLQPPPLLPRPPAAVPSGAVLVSSLPPAQQAALLEAHPALRARAGSVQRTVPSAERGKEKRLECRHGGRLLYEWDQSLDEVNMYLDPPTDTGAAHILVCISSAHLRVGVRGDPTALLDHDLGGRCKHTESYWTLEEHDGAKELHLTLTKLVKGLPWDSALVGHTALDPLTATEVRKDILRERFQAENPGIDFSSTDFNGDVPDPSRFMGGIGYQ